MIARSVLGGHWRLVIMSDTDKLLRALIDALGFDIEEYERTVFASKERHPVVDYTIVDYKLVKRESKIKEELATWKELHDSWRYS